MNVVHKFDDCFEIYSYLKIIVPGSLFILRFNIQNVFNRKDHISYKL